MKKPLPLYPKLPNASRTEKTAFGVDRLYRVNRMVKFADDTSELRRLNVPVDVILYCPYCHEQHVDAPSAACVHDACPRVNPCGPGDCKEPWTNPPHRTHLCHNCGYLWRPSDVPTNGVASIKTKGSNDSPVKEKDHAS